VVDPAQCCVGGAINRSHTPDDGCTCAPNAPDYGVQAELVGPQGPVPQILFFCFLDMII
jgi:hypothetical protein